MHALRLFPTLSPPLPAYLYWAPNLEQGIAILYSPNFLQVTYFYFRLPSQPTLLFSAPEPNMPHALTNTQLPV
jgi:hypothetical protein